MTLEEVAEAIGMRPGRLRQTARELFDTVTKNGRLMVPQDQVVSIVQNEVYYAIGGRGPSPKYYWMLVPGATKPAFH